MPAPNITPAEQTLTTDFQQPPTPATEPIKPASKLPFIIMAVLLVITTSAAAYFYSQLQTNTALPVAPATPTPIATIIPSPSTNPTADWQTYTNQNVGFSIKYPSGWREQEGPAYVGFGPKKVGEDVLIGISYYQKINNKLSEIIDKIGSQFKDRVVIQDSVVINTALVKKVVVTTPSHPDWYSEIIIFETPNAFITVSNGAVKNENYPFDQGVPTGFTFEQFYSTFQVTEQAPTVIDTTSWQTYTNQDFNYKIKYGEEWKLRKTYGHNIEKLATTDILSGTDLHLYRGDYFYANVNVNLLDAKGEPDIDNWITKYDLNYPKAAAVKKVSFNQVSANEYTHQPSGTRISKVLYFIKNDYAYKIWFWGDNQENFNQAEALVETFLTE